MSSSEPLPFRSEIDALFDAQQSNRANVARSTAKERKQKLRRLHDALLAHRDDIRAALWADSGKPPVEVDLGEILGVLGEARHAMRHLRSWMKPRRVRGRLMLIGSASSIVSQPKGVVLIISPWNFPFNLTLVPLVSAIAAGNCAMVKPSELAPHSAACMKRIVGKVFDEAEIAFVEGDGAVAEALLRKKFDHIFFTGSPAVGRRVMKAAAEQLTPVTLELGGKSPVIVDRTADLDEAAKKIAWGKFYNSGQICIAPDYLLVDESIASAFVEKLRACMESHGDESRGLIINDRHAARVKNLFDAAVRQGARVAAGGDFRGRAVVPTVLTNVEPDAAVMQEEIFGPLLPLLTYRSLDEAIQFINGREHPLVMYIFSRDRRVSSAVIARTRAGGTVVNDTLIHNYQPELPFGGVGQSGMGKGHGRFGFDAFSNARAVVESRLKFAPLQWLYPPYRGKLQQKLIDFALRWL
ncbi:MAG TPA: aldehyde dehydrogenase family protein [Thermoanaerobaculia bacterium]|nr:aldehyde dehydrogenase family protein [Thermoanaerobaculia bacterium]